MWPESPSHRERRFCTCWQCPVFEEGRGEAIFPTGHPPAPRHLLLPPGCPSLRTSCDPGARAGPLSQPWQGGSQTLACSRGTHVCPLSWGPRTTCSVRGCDPEQFKHWGCAFVSHSLGISSPLYVELSLFTGKICSTEG